ncbi:MAG: hypothetical protein MJ244_00340 [Clostridia bacterium]|nr:hypothetical protein [Clostridia bacterium]
MKIVKKLKGIISWHFYNDDEMKSIIETVLALIDNKDEGSIPVLTNLFKGSDGDEIAEFYIITGQEENRLYIDNEQKKLILNVTYEDLPKFVAVIQEFLKNKRVPTKEIINIMIAKKEYVLQGFNQQYKRYLKKEKKKTEEVKENNDQKTE